MSIERVPVSVLSTDSTKTILAAQTGRKIRLLSLRVASEASACDFIIEDEDGNNIGGFHHMGTGTGGGHHDDVVLPYCPVGWCETPVSKGLQVSNENAADFEVIAVLAVL